jgi:hypothetical protein
MRAWHLELLTLPSILMTFYEFINLGLASSLCHPLPFFLPAFKDGFTLFLESALAFLQVFAVEGLVAEGFDLLVILRVDFLILQAFIKNDL